MATLEARGLHLRFGDRVVLEDISLVFPDRQFTGIMGPNGAGKTTSFNVLTGRYKPHRGQVLLDGADITGLPPRAIARKGVSRSFQIMNLFNDFSALDNVAVAVPETRARGFSLLGSARKDSAGTAKAEQVLARIGLRGKEQVAAKNLSYGDRRALEIGVALAANPGVLCLDEPTSGLGREATARLADLVRGLRGTLTIVAIEHDMEFLFGLADSIAVIHWGQVIARGTPAELRENPWVKNSNLGKLKAR
jgi:branched-chain amino acid transport system ATP-binding protein